MLFGGESGLRLEPVREVRRASTDRPLLHRLRDTRRDVDVELFAVADGVEEFVVGLARHLVPHLSHAKGVHPEVLGGAGQRAIITERLGADFSFGDLADDGFSG